ncbi:methyl-accepting chemotaxis protein [Virgibacillus sp. W0430]|uniref:methyl-accepting chemotaxis protein n=1 Tax=Virgibacillus sp. W0430 TaxID=3391580 RepID=UPI003F4501D5
MNLFTKTTAWDERVKNSKATNIEIDERSKERLIFLGITKETLAHVQLAAEVVEPYKAEIIDQFYENIVSINHLKGIIKENSTVDRLKITMEKYLDQFLQAELNQEYIKTRMLIGEVHSKINLTAEHFISAHHLLVQYITSIVMEKLYKKKSRMIDAVIGVQKLAAFDQQLIVEVYAESTFKGFLFGISDMINHTTQLDTTQKLIEGMEEQINETHSVSSATEQMSASIQEVSDHAVKVAENTDEAVQSAEQSKFVIDEALHAIENVGTVYDDVVSKVDNLDEEIENTQEVISVIKDIADQTNLLALNASIEAARAGEHGQGFAVVAAEVRKLSEHTKEQIEQITANMTSLHTVSSQVTTQIKQTGERVDQSVTGARTAGTELMNIISKMQSISQGTNQIAAMSEEQASTVQEITNRNTVINELSTDLQKQAEETAKIIFDLSKQMDHYRSTFFATNIRLESKDIIRVAKTDHLLWKWNIYNMFLGLESIGAAEVISHEACRLGKWYYGNTSADFKDHQSFHQLEAPHQAVHQYAKIAVECFEKNDSVGARTALHQLETASSTVITLLSELEK